MTSGSSIPPSLTPEPSGPVSSLRDDGAREAAQATQERDVLAGQLREAFEQSPVSTVVYDAAGHPVAANPAFERLWGAALADVPPSYSVLNDPQLEAAGVLALLRRAFGLDGARTGDAAGQAVTLPALRYDLASTAGRGRTRWTQANAYPVRNATGTVDRVVLSHEDVTARLEAESALREALVTLEARSAAAEASERRVRAVLESISDAFYALDREWNFTYVNARAQEVLGRTADELVGHSIWVEFAPVLGTAIEREYRRAMDTDTVITFEAWYDPLARWFELRASPGSDGLSVYFRDITERQAAEAALGEAEERLRLAVDSTGLGTWDYVPATDTLHWDAQTKRAFGLPEDAVVTAYRTFFELLHPDDRARTQAVVNAATDPAGSGEYDTTFRVDPRGGAERWVRARGRALFGGDGPARHVTRFIGTVLDVTADRVAAAERERLLAALEIERLRLSTVFAQTPSVLAILRGPQHVLEMANEAYLALNGHRDVIGKPLLEAVPELRGQGFEHILDTVVATGEPFVGREVPIWLSTTAGAPPEERYFDFVYLPLVEPDASGAPTRVGVIAHGNDITEQVTARREVERARERADRLQAITAALAATTTPQSVAEVIVARGVAAAGAATGVLVLRAPHVSDDVAAELVILRQTGLPDAVSGEYARFPASAPVPTAESVRTGRPFFLEEPDAVRAAFPEVLGMLGTLGTQALATVPLAVGGESVGAMSFTFTAPRPFPVEDREFFLALGRQAAQALERARLLEAERTARVRAETLQRVTAVLAQAQTMADVGQVFSREITTIVGADTAWVGAVTPDGSTVEALGWAGYADGSADGWHRLALDAGIALTDSVRSASPQWWPTREALAAAYPSRAAVIRALAQDGVALLPILGAGEAEPGEEAAAGGRAIGGIVVGFRAPQRFDADTRAFFIALAQQCAQAIARARAYEAEQTARREAEAARGAAEAANRAKSDFLAVMSHELRTPLNAIGGYAELMEMGIRGPVTPQQAEDLRRVQASQRHLLGLVNEVLNYARIETGTVHYEEAEVPLAAVVAAVEPLVAPQLAAKGLAFALHCAPVAPGERALVARADREKVRQVLLNLLSNAIKFTPQGGTVTVACEAAGAAVALRVTDSGIGIPAAELQRIFEPFVQVNATLTRPHEGTGLGLAISRDLARGMGGDLVVESTLGAGSTFTFTLPRA
jgi:PAS domain S-box-containing protein